VPRSGYRIAWSTPRGQLVAIEPRRDEVAQHAAALAAAYNDPHNAPLLGHTQPLSERDVIAHYEALAGDGHGFLMFREGGLIGDADLRGVSGGAAEFAFLVAEVAAQGKGLGTQLATMIHTFAFAQLGLDRVYASIIPGNVASRRVFEKLGYAVDPGPAARAFADDPDDITMVIERRTFEQLHAARMAEIEIAMR
jgi:RimJ/RimL family protein N-acetyltransferase